MPYRRNIQREEILLRHWREGHTVKVASLLTGIPEGSVSHYYKRFNKNSEKYKKIMDGKYQEPKWTTPFTAAATAFNFKEISDMVMALFIQGEYAKARDLLEMIKLFSDFESRQATIFQNADPKKEVEVVQHLANIYEVQKIMKKIKDTANTT